MLREGASSGRVALVGHSVAHRFGYSRHHSRKVVHLSVAVADEEYVASLLGTARNGRAEQEGYGEKGFLEHCGAVFCFCRLAGVLFAQHYFVEGCDIDLNVVYVGIRVDRNQGGLDELIAFEVEEVACKVAVDFRICFEAHVIEVGEGLEIYIKLAVLYSRIVVEMGFVVVAVFGVDAVVMLPFGEVDGVGIELLGAIVQSLPVAIVVD